MPLFTFDFTSRIIGYLYSVYNNILLLNSTGSYQYVSIFVVLHFTSKLFFSQGNSNG